jgi:hypothetical protein
MKRVRRALQFVGNLAAFCCGLAGIAAIIHRVAPPPWVSEFTEKRLFLAQHRDEIDTIFLGSSRVKRQISPAVFDATTASLGEPTHSFNFGLDAMGHPELPYVVDQILALHPQGLKNVFVELTHFRREFGPLNPADSMRVIYWHNYRYTAAACRAVWRDPDGMPLDRKLTATWWHFYDCARWEWNVGGSAAWPGTPLFKDSALGPEGRGFLPVPEHFPEAKKAEFLKQTEELQRRRNDPPWRDPVFEELTLDMLAKLRVRGVRTFVMVMPRIFPQPPWVPGADATTPLRFDDPVKDAVFFDPAMRYDAQHLNADGAKVFSRELAERFVRIQRDYQARPSSQSRAVLLQTPAPLQ